MPPACSSKNMIWDKGKHMQHSYEDTQKVMIVNNTKSLYVFIIFSLVLNKTKKILHDSFDLSKVTGVWLKGRFLHPFLPAIQTYYKTQ